MRALGRVPFLLASIESSPMSAPMSEVCCILIYSLDTGGYFERMEHCHD